MLITQLSNPTKQQAFTHVLLSLREQKSASMDNLGMGTLLSPAYRGSNNTKCAIGHWIPDDQYKPEMEGLSLIHFYQEGFFKGSLSWMGEPDMFGLLSAMQEAHDDVLSPHGIEKWEEVMRNIAQQFSLIYVEPKQ